MRCLIRVPLCLYINLHIGHLIFIGCWGTGARCCAILSWRDGIRNSCPPSEAATSVDRVDDSLCFGSMTTSSEWPAEFAPSDLSLLGVNLTRAASVTSELFPPREKPDLVFAIIIVRFWTRPCLVVSNLWARFNGNLANKYPLNRLCGTSCWRNIEERAAFLDTSISEVVEKVLTLWALVIISLVCQSKWICRLRTKRDWA